MEVLTRHLPQGAEENHEKLQSPAGVPAEIETEHLPNTIIERYHLTTPFGHFVLISNTELGPSMSASI
jgi:hypothetical protein